MKCAAFVLRGPICTRKGPYILRKKAEVAKVPEERRKISEMPVFKGFLSI
jgi:hypothetical protein